MQYNIRMNYINSDLATFPSGVGITTFPSGVGIVDKTALSI